MNKLPSKKWIARASTDFKKSKRVLNGCMGVAALGLSIAAMAEAGDVHEIKCNNSFEEIVDEQPSGWGINKIYDPQGVMRAITGNAKEGKNCIEIENVGDAQFAFFVKESQDVKVGDKIRLNIYAKGHGKFRLDLGYYTGTNVHWWGHHPSEQGQLIDVDSEEWTLQSREVTVPNAENTNGETITVVKPFIVISTDSKLQFDCFGGQIISGEE
ncbi:MAG: hypothetical protein WC765_09225 [Phycisphaerae bacterium]|jgi:hypothetical protein